LRTRPIEQQHEGLISLRKSVNGSDVFPLERLLVKASGLVILFSGGLLLTCALAVIVRGKSFRLSALHPSPLTLVVGLCGALGALLSSAVLYVSYRPYAEILQRFIRDGDQMSLPELSSFLDTTRLPLGAQGFLDVWQFVFYFLVRRRSPMHPRAPGRRLTSLPAPSAGQRHNIATGFCDVR